MVFSKGVFMSATKLIISKITAVILIVFSLIMLVFFGAYVFAPEATEGFISGMPSWAGEILNAMTFDEAESALSIGTFFEKIGIPSYTFSVADGEIPVLSVNLAAIIVFVILLLLSNFLKPLSLITTLAVNIVAGITAIGIIEGYEYAVLNGISSWAAASSSFLPMLVMFAVLLFSGCDQWVGVIAGLDERRHFSEYFAYSTGFLFAAAVIAFVLTAIAWLIMGLGWAGFAFIAFFLICVVSVIMEAISLFHVSYI